MKIAYWVKVGAPVQPQNGLVGFRELGGGGGGFLCEGSGIPPPPHIHKLTLEWVRIFSVDVSLPARLIQIDRN